jgi:hypothetical protein
MLSKIIVDGTLLGLPLATVAIFLRDAVWNLGRQIWGVLSIQIPIYCSVIFILIGILSLLIFKSFKKPSYFFFDYDRVKWRANKRTGEIEPHPYCIFHQVQLVWDQNESYYCPLDGQRKDLPTKYDIQDTRKGAQSVATAIVNQHIKNAEINRTK